MATNETTSCPLCRHEHVKIFAVGDCSHPVCFLCSVKMRILCEETYCAICRQDLSRVFFVSNLAEAQGKLDPSAFSPIDDSGVCGIFYPTKSEWIRRKAEKLLRNFCPMCGTEFESFDVLRQHVQKQHRAFYCDLCVEHLNLFPHERKYYTRSELVQHLRNGDRDDKSMRGHPLCKFCNDHFLDNDQLYKHMRQEHYYCHLCSSDNVYYSTFELLRDHYRSAHYLCEIDQCRDVQFTNVFPNEFEFRAHQAAQHSKNRAAARQLGKVQVEFQSSNSRDRRQQEGPTQNERDETNREGNVATNVPSIDEFPTLGQSGSSTQASSHQRGAWAGEQRGNHLNEDFPALTNVASTSGQPRGFWRENPTQSTTSKTTPAVKTVPDSSSFKAREDFPALQPAANARILPPVSLVSAWSNAKKSAKTGNGASKKNYQPQMRMNSNRILNDNEEDEEWIRRPMATLMTSSAPQVSSNITMISSSEVNSTATTTNKNQTVPKSQDFPALPTTVRAAARSPVPSGVWTANATAAAPPASSQSKKKSGLSSKKKFLDEIKAMSTETTTTTDQPVVRLTEIGRQLITEETPEVKKGERPSSAPSTTESPKEKKTTTPSKKKKSPKATTSNDTPAEKQPSTSPTVLPSDSNLPQNRTTSSKPVESAPIVETTLPVSTPSAPPPPGFSASAGTVHPPPPPGFDIASASQPSYIFSSSYDKEKEAFQAKLVKLFDGDMNLFTEYDRFCQAFAEKNINSTAFLSFTRELFQEKFNDYLLELIVLIPNIDQQNEVYALWNKENPSSGTTASNWTKKPSAGSAEISQCHRCRQLMFASQAEEHKTHHSDFNADFPSLPAASVSLVRSKGKKSK